MSSYALMTNLGRNKEAASIAAGTALTMTEIAWGDGTRIPAGGETTLENEQGRKAINGNGVLAEALNTAFFEVSLSAAEGPFVIREAGLFDADGDMIAIARFDPPVNKPQNSVTAIIRMNVVFSDLENLVLTVEQDNTFVPAMPRQDAILAADLSGEDYLTIFDKSADTHKKLEVEAAAGRLRDLASATPFESTAIADNSALNDITQTSYLTAAAHSLAPPLASGAEIEHREFNAGNATQIAHRITSAGIYLSDYIRTRRGGVWSAWTPRGFAIGQGVKLRSNTGLVPSLLEENGDEVLRDDFPDLFADIGTLYGAGDGVTTFNIPQFQGEFERGWDNGRGVDAGRIFASFAADEFRAHTHLTNIGGAHIVTGGGLGVGQWIAGAHSGSTGGGETRPRSIATFFTIAY